MNDYDNWNDSETYSPAYARPAAAAWIAAAAVAVVVIVAGGYIHTYRSFAAYKKWSASELKKLDDELTALRAASRSAAGANASGRRISGDPARRAAGGGVPPAAERATGRTAAPLAPAPPPPSAGESVSADAGRASRPTITAESGLSSFFVGSRQAGTPSESSTRFRIIAVSKDQKRINMEGGRDQSLSEGERLELSRDGRWIGDLRVITVFDNMAACEVLHSITMPEPGDLVRVPVGSVSDSL